MFPVFLSFRELQSPLPSPLVISARAYVHAHARIFVGMDRRQHPMHRKLKRTHTRAQLAALLGCSVWTVDRLRRSFLTDRQRAYLNAAGYSAAFYPMRKDSPVPTPA